MRKNKHSVGAWTSEPRDLGTLGFCNFLNFPMNLVEKCLSVSFELVERKNYSEQTSVF